MPIYALPFSSAVPFARAEEPFAPESPPRAFERRAESLALVEISLFPPGCSVCEPPPATYCAYAPDAPTIATVTTKIVLVEPGLPHVLAITEAATHAPNDAFQIVRYGLFTKANHHFEF